MSTEQISNELANKLANEFSAKLCMESDWATQTDDSDSEDDVEVIINDLRLEKPPRVKRPAPTYKQKICSAPCISVGSSVPCPHGKKCSFAHTKFEFRPKECQWGEECRAVHRYEMDKYENARHCKRKCVFIHPYESLTSACVRLSIPEEPVKVQEEPISVKPERTKVAPPIQEPTKVAPPKTESKPLQITLNVSKHEVADVIQNLLKGGFTQFNINIVD